MTTQKSISLGTNFLIIVYILLTSYVLYLSGFSMLLFLSLLVALVLLGISLVKKVKVLVRLIVLLCCISLVVANRMIAQDHDQADVFIIEVPTDYEGVISMIYSTKNFDNSLNANVYTVSKTMEFFYVDKGILSGKKRIVESYEGTFIPVHYSRIVNYFDTEMYNINNQDSIKVFSYLISKDDRYLENDFILDSLMNLQDSSVSILGNKIPNN